MEKIRGRGEERETAVIQVMQIKTMMRFYPSPERMTYQEINQ